MNRLIKTVLVIMVLLNLTACSYSPNALKDIYRGFGSEFANQLSKPFNLTGPQQKIVNDYTKRMMQWHRQNKLPEYAQRFGRLERALNSKNIALPELQSFVGFIDEVPHFEQAKYLTPKMAALGKSLTDHQVVQLDKHLSGELQQQSREASKSSISKEYSDGFIEVLKFIGIKLNQQQKQIIIRNTKNLHDLRFEEIKGEKLWNKRLIVILNKRKRPGFIAGFSNHWNTQGDDSIRRNKKLIQHNKRIIAVMIKKLYLSLDQRQKNKASEFLQSVSHTLSEMANE